MCYIHINTKEYHSTLYWISDNDPLLSNGKIDHIFSISWWKLKATSVLVHINKYDEINGTSSQSMYYQMSYFSYT